MAALPDFSLSFKTYIIIIIQQRFTAHLKIQNEPLFSVTKENEQSHNILPTVVYSSTLSKQPVCTNQDFPC